MILNVTCAASFLTFVLTVHVHGGVIVSSEGRRTQAERIFDAEKQLGYDNLIEVWGEDDLKTLPGKKDTLDNWQDHLDSENKAIISALGNDRDWERDPVTIKKLKRDDDNVDIYGEPRPMPGFTVEKFNIMIKSAEYADTELSKINFWKYRHLVYEYVSGLADVFLWDSCKGVDEQKKMIACELAIVAFLKGYELNNLDCNHHKRDENAFVKIENQKTALVGKIIKYLKDKRIVQIEGEQMITSLNIKDIVLRALGVCERHNAIKILNAAWGDVVEELLTQKISKDYGTPLFGERPEVDHPNNSKDRAALELPL